MNKMKLKQAADAAKPVWPMIAGAGVVGLSTGTAVGYFVARKQLETKYEAQFDKEVKALRDVMNHHVEEAVEEVVEELTPEPEVEDREIKVANSKEYEVVEVTSREQYHEVAAMYEREPQVEEDIQITDNVWVSPSNGRKFNYTAEEQKRSEDEPYVISEEEFMAQEKQYETACMTYYVEDDVLADDDEVPVDNPDRLVGSEAFLRFGDGSTSDDVVFVRNDRLGMEFEIERNFKSYSEEVLGFLDESRSKSPRLRGEDG